MPVSAEKKTYRVEFYDTLLRRWRPLTDYSLTLAAARKMQTSMSMDTRAVERPNDA